MTEQIMAIEIAVVLTLSLAVTRLIQVATRHAPVAFSVPSVVTLPVE